MIHRVVFVLLLLAMVMLTACDSFMRRDSNQPVSVAELKRNQGYALLYSTINAESSLDQILIIKDPEPQVAELIKAITLFARNARDTLQAFAKEDPGLSIDESQLPEVEINTRDSISSTTTNQLLLSGGKDFEFRVLLTQHEALNYITHLAAALSEHETHGGRRMYLTTLADHSKALHERVITQMAAAYIAQAK